MKKITISCLLFCIVGILNASKTTTDLETGNSPWLKVYKQMRSSLSLDRSKQLLYKWDSFDSKLPIFKEFVKSALLKKLQQKILTGKCNILVLGLNSNKRLDLTPLAKLPRLDALTLYVRNVDLSNIPLKIKVLSLIKTSSESLASITDAPDVEVLYLSKVANDTDWMKFFTKSVNLKILFWHSPPENFEFDAHSLPKLEYLIVKRFNTISLSSDLHLKGLALSMCQNTCLPDFKGIRLEELVIKNSSRLKDYSSISSLVNLRRLTINKTPLTDLKFLKNLKLEYLDIRNTPMSNKAIPKWLNIKKVLK